MQACFDANTGKCSSCKTLNRASESAGGSWKAVGLLMTTSHIVVTGCNGSIDWLTLPSESGNDLEVRLAVLSTTVMMLMVNRMPGIWLIRSTGRMTPIHSLHKCSNLWSGRIQHSTAGRRLQSMRGSCHGLQSSLR